MASGERKNVFMREQGKSDGEFGEEKLRAELKAVITDFSENSSAHGPPKIVRHKFGLAKLFWVLLFLTGIGFFSYFSQKLIRTYLKYESTTDIELKFDVLDFPAISICNMNQFRRDRLPEAISQLAEDFLDSRRYDMWGGQDYFYEHFQSNPTEDALNIWSWWSESTTAPNRGRSSGSTRGRDASAATTSTTTDSTSRASRKKRSVRKQRETESTTKKGATYEVPADKLEIIKDLEGFYRKPEAGNLTWFANVGQPASENTILLNLTKYISEHYATDTMLREYGHDIEEMLQECVFQGRTCGPEDFYQFYDRTYGNCYTFNSGLNGRISRVTSPGAAFGLSLTLFINQPTYIPALSTQAGIRILLHRHGEVPLVAEEGFNTSPGTKSSIAVKYVEIERLYRKTGSICTQQSKRPTNGGLHEFYPGNYTLQACLKTCLQKGIIEACGCANVLYRGPAGESTCGPDQYGCVESIETEMLESDACTELCPLPCWESQYQHTISTSQWPSHNYEPYLKQTYVTRGDAINRVLAEERSDGIADEFVKLEIYFDNLNYYRYKERETMTFEDLVGALGGHLGLWIGMSIISFVEIFELIVSLFGVCAKMMCKRTNQTAVQRF